jgi:hypothetical protein
MKYWIILAALSAVLLVGAALVFADLFSAGVRLLEILTHS